MALGWPRQLRVAAALAAARWQRLCHSNPRLQLSDALTLRAQQLAGQIRLMRRHHLHRRLQSLLQSVCLARQLCHEARTNRPWSGGTLLQKGAQRVVCGVGTRDGWLEQLEAQILQQHIAQGAARVQSQQHNLPQGVTNQQQLTHPANCLLTHPGDAVMERPADRVVAGANNIAQHGDVAARVARHERHVLFVAKACAPVFVMRALAVPHELEMLARVFDYLLDALREGVAQAVRQVVCCVLYDVANSMAYMRMKVFGTCGLAPILLSTWNSGTRI